MEIISAKYVITLTNNDEPIEEGAIAVELGRIEDVGTAEELTKKHPGVPVNEYSNNVIMPGLINAHTQLDLNSYYERNKSFLSEDPSVPDYLDWLIGMMEYRNSANHSERIAGIQAGMQKAIDAGTTCLGDTTTFEGTHNFFDEMGLRGVVYNEIYAGGKESGQELFENAIAIVEKYFDPSGNNRVNAGLCPTAAYLLSKNLLHIVAQHAQSYEVPLKIHAAETFAEMEFFFDSSGPIGTKLFPTIGWKDELPPLHQKTPVNYLAEIGFLGAAPAVIGGIHLSDKCLHQLARSMCRIIYCPTFNSYFGHGTLPISKIQEIGIPIALGTSASLSSNTLSLWDEMREALRLTPGSPTPKEIIQMATIGGARALGLENQIGTLAEGKLADYIVIDLPPGHEIDKTYIYGALIRNTHPYNVKKTVVAGEVLKNI